MAITGRAYGIAIDATSVYWNDVAGVMKCAVGGCAQGPTRLATWAGSVIAVSATTVFWGRSTELMACAVSGCNQQPTDLGWFGDGFEGIALDDESVYGTYCGGHGGAVVKCAQAGCNGQPTQFDASGCATGLAVDNAAVYWGAAAGVMKCARAGCNGRPTTLVATPPDPSFITSVGDVATDSVDVYWADYHGRIRKCSKDGCNNQPTTLVTEQLGDSLRIAVDGTSVYWTNNRSGAVMKIAK